MLFGFIKLELSLGDILLSLATLGAAWYVGSALKKKQDRDIALRDLIRFFCREALRITSEVSDTIRGEFGRADGGFDNDGRNRVLVVLQRLSNSIHAAELTVREGKLTGHDKAIRVVTDSNEQLRKQILDPLMTEQRLPAGDARAIEGAIRAVSEAVISLEIEVISNLQ